MPLFPRYNKQEAPVWERKLTLVLGFLFGVTLLLFAVWAIVLYANRAELDECQDGGDFDRVEPARCESAPNRSTR